jgi:hypothetical protein
MMLRHVRYPALGILVALISSLLVALTVTPSHGEPTHDGSALAGSTAAPLKAAVRRSTVRLRTAPTRAIAGERVRHRVQVAPKVKRKVVLQRARVDGGWARVVVGNTNRSGRIVFRTRNRAVNTIYRAVIVKQKIGKKWYSADQSPLRRVVAQRQSLELTLPISAVRSENVRVRVDAAPARRGRPVTLQRLTENGWRVVDDATQSRRGVARFRVVAPRRTGEFLYRAVAQRWRGAKAATSTRETLRAVDPTPNDVTAPAAPTGLTAEPGNRTVTLTWNAVAAPDLSIYQVYRAASADGPWTSLGTASDTAFVVPRLDNGTQYFFTVTAADFSGNVSDRSAHASATPVAPDVTPPPVPTGLAAAPGSGQVTLSWEPVAADDLEGYRVYVRLATDGEWAPRPGLPAGTTRAIEGLENGTAYDFYVTSLDRRGNESDGSSVVTAVPEAGTP